MTKKHLFIIKNIRKFTDNGLLTDDGKCLSMEKRKYILNFILENKKELAK